MKINPRSLKWTYVLYAVLTVFVIGTLTWATVASLQLERNDRQRALAIEYENKVRSSMSQMEKWANPILFNEFQRDYTHYAPFYFPSTDQVRLATGEMLAPGTLVQPSPLLVNPPQQPWILLHFQASPHSGYRSPQVIPDTARYWPGFDEAYDTWNRESYSSVLSSLEYSYSTDELTHLYDLAHEESIKQHLIDERLAMNSETYSDPDTEQGKHKELIQSHYNRERINTAINQRDQIPPTACEPKTLATENLLTFSQSHLPTSVNDNLAEEDLVPVELHRMLPVWIKLGSRSTKDLAFIRLITVGGETALQGFIVDWPAFSKELLSRIRYIFPKATITVNKTPAIGTTESSFSLIPARLVPNEPPKRATLGVWNTTYTFLVIGWCASAILLTTLGLGIHYVIVYSERRSQFAYAVTHELRTPLTTFRLYTDMLAQGLVAEKDKQDYLNTLNDESKRLSDLVAGVLEYSRVENNSVPANKHLFSIGELMNEVQTIFETRCGATGASLELDHNGLAEHTIKTDRQLVTQIIGNLIDNACKYGQNKSGTRIAVRIDKKEGAYRFEVSDNGQGIPPRLRSTVFKPYERGDKANTPATGGIGLGLSLSRSWAKLLGGQLVLLHNAQRQSGATFRLTLPAD